MKQHSILSHQHNDAQPHNHILLDHCALFSPSSSSSFPVHDSCQHSAGTASVSHFHRRRKHTINNQLSLLSLFIIATLLCLLPSFIPTLHVSARTSTVTAPPPPPPPCHVGALPIQRLHQDTQLQTDITVLLLSDTIRQRTTINQINFWNTHISNNHTVYLQLYSPVVPPQVYNDTADLQCPDAIVPTFIKLQRSLPYHPAQLGVQSVTVNWDALPGDIVAFALPQANPSLAYDNAIPYSIQPEDAETALKDDSNYALSLDNPFVGVLRHLRNRVQSNAFLSTQQMLVEHKRYR